MYAERLDSIKRTIAMDHVERVPSIYIGTAFAPRYMGGKIARFCNDMEYAFEMQLDAMDRLGSIDSVNIATGRRIGPILSALWLSRVAMPGVELPDDTLWQVMEEERSRIPARQGGRSGRTRRHARIAPAAKHCPLGRARLCGRIDLMLILS